MLAPRYDVDQRLSFYQIHCRDDQQVGQGGTFDLAPGIVAPIV